MDGWMDTKSCEAARRSDLRHGYRSTEYGYGGCALRGWWLDWRLTIHREDEGRVTVGLFLVHMEKRSLRSITVSIVESRESSEREREEKEKRSRRVFS